MDHFFARFLPKCESDTKEEKEEKEKKQYFQNRKSMKTETIFFCFLPKSKNECISGAVIISKQRQNEKSFSI